MEWVKVTDRLPEESGQYFIARVSSDGYVFYWAEPYSARHKAFGAWDCLDEARLEVDVDYWMPIPPLGGVGE